MSNARYTIFAARAVFDVDSEKGITATELRVLAALGTYASNEGWCWPNQTTLAERLKLTRQTISGAVKKLVDKGYVETEVRTAKGRGKVGYKYRVMLDMKAVEEQPEADANQADVGEGRQRHTPTTAAADVGEDRDPMSAQASVAYNEGTIPSERAQQSSPVSKETEEDRESTKPDPYKTVARAKAEAKGKAQRTRKPAAYTADFEMIWMQWPKHKRMRSDKRKSFERYQAGVAQFGVPAIKAAANLYLSSPDTRKDCWKYCCAVEVFMNGKLEAAVEAALEEAPSETITHGDAEDRAAKRYHEKTGRWPQGYHPPLESRS